MNDGYNEFGMDERKFRQFVLHFIISFSVYNSSYPHFWVHYQTNPAKQHFYPPSPYKIYCPHSQDAQASGCCSQALGKFLLTFPVCFTFHCMTVSTNRYHQHLM